MKKLTVEILEKYLQDNYQNSKDEQGLFMKLVEEIGEVAEVLNIRNKRKGTDANTSDEESINNELAKELVDVIHYAVAIAAINDINIEKAIIDKDKKASVKYHHVHCLEDYLKD